VLDDKWLTFGLATGVTGATCESVIEQFGSIGSAIDAPSRELLSAGLSATTIESLQQPDAEQLQRCTEWLGDDDCHLLTWSDPRYPSLLREIASPPALLFVRGDADVLNLPQLAMVGSRNATPTGIETAENFAAHLARSGFSLTSGLALGIDAAVHRATLAAGGTTIAVLGTGPDQIYPAVHTGLAEQIVAQGALVSEFPPGCPPRRAQFPQRNRIISGLTLGTLVVEAGTRSGALITARFAAEQGREVFAIPGSIHNPVARGCHQLIRSGAKLVETARDIVEELGGMLESYAASIEQNMVNEAVPPARALDSDYQSLLDLMGWDPVSVDTLIKRSGLTTAEVSSMLLLLELHGRVDPLAGGRYVQREEGQSQ